MSRDLANQGFLPSGLFERLIGRAVQWSQQTARSLVDTSDISKNCAILYYGNQMFRLIHHPEFNSIQVDVEGESPVAIHTRLKGQLEKIIEECMKSLRFITLLPYTPGEEKKLVDASFIAQESFFGISLTQVIRACQSHSALNIRAGGGRKRLDTKEIQDRFGMWIENTRILDYYDVFISYRWNRLDKEFTQGLFDQLTLFNIDIENNRAIRTFLDTYRLQEGDLLQSEFLRALRSTAIVTPIVSRESLRRLENIQDVMKEDNMLVEWMCSMIFHQYATLHPKSQVRVRKIIPIMFGSILPIDEGFKMNSLFQEGVIDRLSDISPKGSVELVQHEMKKLDANILSVPEIEQRLQRWTIRSIVQDILKFNGIPGWEHFRILSAGNSATANHHLLNECSTHLLANLRRALSELPAIPQSQSTAIANTSSSKPQATIATPQTKAKKELPASAAASAKENSQAVEGGSELSKKSVKELIDRIKQEFSIEKDKMQEILEEAAASISDEAVEMIKQMKNLKDKALYLLKEVGIE